MYRSYTFSKYSSDVRYQYCSRRAALKCKARLRLDRVGKIVFADDTHNHPPPRFYRDRTGMFTKIAD
ncbi:hypothetical protein JYU34_004375 [Plutella xylostella]|uniref:FLYWCH-type domain-containing protein n=1 Tax=Plutella xylostella TaxID=51655 RepID=A0ABQ7QXT3_PLUXY|nr:hypothetical protein JYU34_004375 [Plutella xylostella]